MVCASNYWTQAHKATTTQIRGGVLALPVPCSFFRQMVSCLTLLASLCAVVCDAGSSHAAVSKFSTPEQLKGLRWDGITHLHQVWSLSMRTSFPHLLKIRQAISKLTVHASGEVTPADPVAWPEMVELVTAAHGNRSLIVLGCGIESKPAAQQMFAAPVWHSGCAE